MNRRSLIKGAASTALAASIPFSATWPVPATTYEMITHLLRQPLVGEGKDGWSFAITRRGLDEEFGGRIDNIRWPEGRYGVVFDTATENLMVFTSPKGKGVAHFIEAMDATKHQFRIIRWVG